MSVACLKALIKTLWHHQPPLNKQIHTIKWIDGFEFWRIAHPSWKISTNKHHHQINSRSDTQIVHWTRAREIKCIRLWNARFIHRKFGMCQWNLVIFEKYWSKSNGLVYGRPVLRIYLRSVVRLPLQLDFHFLSLSQCDSVYLLGFYRSCIFYLFRLNANNAKGSSKRTHTLHNIWVCRVRTERWSAFFQISNTFFYSSISLWRCLRKHLFNMKRAHFFLNHFGNKFNKGSQTNPYQWME